MDYTLLDLESLLRKVGRGVVFYAHDGAAPTVGNPSRWDFVSPLDLAVLGDTEGDITFVANATVADLTLPEIAGDAIFESTYTGENPQLAIPLYLADPDILDIVSPIGAPGAGHIRVQEVSERTVVVFPEALFRKTDGTYATLSHVGGVFLLDGAPLTSAQQTLLNMTIWLWRGYFMRPDRALLGGHGNDGKNIQTVNFNVMMHPDLPDGQRLYTVGDPTTTANGSINIGGAS